jgi:hypothetical protein
MRESLIRGLFIMTDNTLAPQIVSQLQTAPAQKKAYNFFSILLYVLILILSVSIFITGIYFDQKFLQMKKGKPLPPQSNKVQQKTDFNDKYISGHLLVTFRPDADLLTAINQFKQLGLTVPATALITDHIILATPHRGQGRIFKARLTKDPLVINVDDSISDYFFKQEGSLMVKDEDWLQVTLNKATSHKDINTWLKNSYPELSDISYSNLNQEYLSYQVTYLNTDNMHEKGEIGNSGPPNPWYEPYHVEIYVPAGQEIFYQNKIFELNSIRGVDFEEKIGIQL